MAESSNVIMSASGRIQDYEYLYASNTNVSNFVSVKLSGSHNYLLWKAQLLCLLDSNNMGGIVDATFVAPRDSGLETMRQYDSLLRGWIFGSVSEDVLVEVFNLSSAKAVWEKLKSIYDPTTCLQNEISDVVSAIPIEIIVGEDQSAPVNEDARKVDQKRKLHEATIKGNWVKVKSILKKDQDLVTEAISGDGSTVLHIAVLTGQNDLFKKLLSNINDEQVLIKRNSDGSTPLHIAAIVGNKHAAELLVKKNNRLLRIEDHKGEEPLQKAYENMHLDTIRYLLKSLNAQGNTTASESSLAGFPHPHVDTAVDLLVNAISAREYPLALELLKQFPNVASRSDQVLMVIAKTFPSGLAFKERLFMLLTFSFMPFIGAIALSSVFVFTWLLLLGVCVIFPVLYLMWWKGVNFILFAPIKKKREQNEAKKVLEMVCNEVDKLDYSGTHHPYYTQSILEAACLNADKVVKEILHRSPQAIKSTDKNGYDIIQLAIIHRSEKIYNLIDDIGERKNLYRNVVDSSENNILHLVGKLAPSSVLNHRTRCAALQLQRDLQWREEVKKFVFPSNITKENLFKETPDMVFTREHKNLVMEGERWMKTTTKSCSITAALITTLVFTALITIPGGSDLVKGTPLLEKKTTFIIFFISDAISLFISCTALLVFLSIQTTHFDEQDFLVSLPRRLFIGLFFLLLSITAMMVACIAILFLVFCDKKPWMLALMCGLAFIPISFFVTLQFPLMVDLFMSTYIGIFGKHKKLILQ